MKILVVGGGGREHAIVQALRTNLGERELYCAPGNAGIAQHARLLDIAADDIAGIVTAVEREGIHFTVVGPEAPLVAGLVDALDARGHMVFGPCAAAARLEGSKAYAKQAMEEAGVPTARWRHVRSLRESIDAVHELANPGVVVKADGLAAGKGVTVADSTEQAEDALREIFSEAPPAVGVSGTEEADSDVDDAAPSASPSALVEERLSGRELSLMALCDGENVIPLSPTRDYKRILDGDLGPNTGGMGAYSPVSELEEGAEWDMHEDVHEPIVRLMESRGIPYHGVLYAGVMLTEDGPRVLEYNVRFGDPETQALLPRLNADFLDLLLRASRSGGLIWHDPETEVPTWSSKAAVTVVLASAGYPATSSSGDPISGLEDVPEDVVVTHAGTASRNGDIVTAGGRVLNVTATGEDIGSAREAAYAAARMISFKGMQMRGDIAADAAGEVLWRAAWQEEVEDRRG
jgi:phosphoribosylamine--glycine ligase